MPVDPDLAGREFPPTRPYVASRASIDAFATSLGLPAGADTAPPTYPIVVAFSAMNDFLEDPSVGVRLHNIVHGEQRFTYDRPVRPGDELVATLTVDSVRAAAGMDMIGTSTTVTTTDGESVCTATATIVHREQEA